MRFPAVFQVFEYFLLSHDFGKLLWSDSDSRRDLLPGDGFGSPEPQFFVTSGIFIMNEFFNEKYPPPRLCATAWLRGHEFCVLSSVFEFWLMVYGFVLKNCLLGGWPWSYSSFPRRPGPSELPPSGPPKINIFAPWTSKNQYLRSLDL